MTEPTADTPKFEHVIELARRLGRHILVFDIESTTFRGRANFGITEIACCMVLTHGNALSFSSLINPERPIDPAVVALNGITNADVAAAETWGKRYAGLFQQMARDHWVTGFNSRTFDEPAVKDMNLRYGKPIEKFEYSFDVRQLHLTLSGSKSRKGNLADTAASYNVKPRGDLHRANADTILTLELLNAIIEVYGLDAVCELILPPAEGAVDRLTPQAIAKYVKSRKAVTLEVLAKDFSKDTQAVSFEVGKAIDERMVDPVVFAVQSAQDWLDQALMEVEADLLLGGRLRPLHDRLAQHPHSEGQLDYVQLRIALLRAGLNWASLKPVD